MFSADLGGATPASAPAATDPPFQKVALLLHGDGTNGAQNNTFVDSSSNNFTITRNGNTTQGTFSPFSLAEGQWSNYFEGTTSYLTVPSTISFGPIGSTPFTIETWVYPTKKGGWIFSGTQGDSNNLICQFFLGDNPNNTSTNYVGLGWYGWAYVRSSTEIPLNTWTHIAGVFTGSATKIYINGVEDTTGTLTSWSSAAGSSYYIGSKWGLQDQGGGQFRGNLSNLRIVKGTALYTTNFTPPTSPLIAIPGTVLLTCQSNRFKDNSSNNSTITPTGGTKVTAFSPFAPSAAYSAGTNGGSGYFDGTGDKLSIEVNSAFSMGSGDFTVETWVYQTGKIGPYPRLIHFGPFWSSNDSWGILPRDNDYPTKITVASFKLGGRILVSSSDFVLNVWNHVAVTRSAGVFRLFVNGILEATNSSFIGTSIESSSINSVCIGSAIDRSVEEDFLGNIYNVRVVKGTAVYTAAFTPPTAPLTAITNTSLLCNCTNAGIIDNSGKNDIETVGNAQISTSVKKYGTGSMYFDGSGDRLTMLSSNQFVFEGDFTIEWWMYPTAISNYQSVIGNYTANATGNWSYDLYLSKIYFYFNAGVTSVSGSTTLSNNTWYHIAVSRSGSTIRIYVNGVQNASTTSFTGTLGLATQPVVIGDRANGSSPFAGYIDDLRITKGQALYTSNFTPPTQAFPNV